MSDIVVCKAGGWVMKDAKTIRKFIELVKADPRRRIVIVSAPGASDLYEEKVTDLLYGFEPMFDWLLNESIIDQFEERLGELCFVLSPKKRAEIMDDLKTYREDGAWSNASKDWVVSRGEYFMAKILAKARGYRFVDSVDFIRFDSRGNLDMRETQIRADLFLQEMSEKCGFAIPGFYGAWPNGRTRLFPRNASDLSGAIVATLAKAARYEIWKERGVLMASPKIVPHARRVPYLTYDEARALTDRGSEVVYPEAVELMRREGIPIYVRSLDDLEETTLIQSDEDTPRSEAGISGISSREKMSILTVQKSGMHEATGVAAKILDAVSEHGVRVHHLHTGIDSVDVVVETDAIAPKLARIAATIEESLDGAEILHKPDFALITVVGREMDLNVQLKVLTALWLTKNEPITYEQGSERHIFTLTVPQVSCASAIRAIYEEFK